MKKYLLFLLIAGMFSASYAQEELVTKYRDVLNIKNIPADTKDIASYAFFDLGSWFGFALPPANTSLMRGSFIGPRVVSDARWLSDNFLQFHITDAATGKELNLADGKTIEISYYPGILVQKYLYDNIYIEENLIFISDRTAVIRVQIRCLEGEDHTINAYWTGSVFADGTKLVSNPGEVDIAPSNSNTKFFIHWEREPVKQADVENNKFNIGYNANIKLEKMRYASLYLFVTQYQNEGEKKRENALTADFAGYPKKYFDFNKMRWNDYLTKTIKTNQPWGDEAEYKRAAVKCMLTLMNNWKSPMGALKHGGIVPSYSHNYFTGFWGWDSWKHAATLAFIDPAIAKDQVRAMFDFQNAKGMIPDCVFIDSTKNNWLDSKPPLAAWAVWNIYEADKDKNFLAEIYPKLVKYHKWWYDERDHNKNGLCEYGATADSLIGAKWESGMDNAIRFDDTRMLKNGEGAYSINLESVDLNSYLYAEKIFLSKIADALGHTSESAQFIKEAGDLKYKIEETFFDEKNNYFFDVNIDNKKFVQVYGPEGWIPLWSLAASQEEADAVHTLILDPAKFNTYIPFPTVSADNPKLDTKGYWRGPVWLDQSYFALTGLRNYGYIKDAEKLTEKTFDHLDGFVNSDEPIRENYNPLTGKGLEANNFSWSAAHLLLMWWGK